MTADEDLERFESSALQVLVLLNDDSLETVVRRALALQKATRITVQDVTDIFKDIGRTVGGIRKMVKSEIRRFFVMESDPLLPGRRRTLSSALEALERMGMYRGLAQELLVK